MVNIPEASVPNAVLWKSVHKPCLLHGWLRCQQWNWEMNVLKFMEWTMNKWGWIKIMSSTYKDEKKSSYNFAPEEHWIFGNHMVKVRYLCRTSSNLKTVIIHTRLGQCQYWVAISSTKQLAGVLVNLRTYMVLAKRAFPKEVLKWEDLNTCMGLLHLYSVCILLATWWKSDPQDRKLKDPSVGNLVFHIWQLYL